MKLLKILTEKLIFRSSKLIIYLLRKSSLTVVNVYYFILYYRTANDNVPNERAVESMFYVIYMHEIKQATEKLPNVHISSRSSSMRALSSNSAGSRTSIFSASGNIMAWINGSSSSPKVNTLSSSTSSPDLRKLGLASEI
jgi:hypothetical protein